MMRSLRFPRIGGLVAFLCLAFLGIPACSAILGIENIPNAGEFAIDAGGHNCEYFTTASQKARDKYCSMAEHTTESGCTISCTTRNSVALPICHCEDSGLGSSGFSSGSSSNDDAPIGEDSPTTSGDASPEGAPPTDACSAPRCSMDVTPDTTNPPETGPESSSTGFDSGSAGDGSAGSGGG